MKTCSDPACGRNRMLCPNCLIGDDQPVRDEQTAAWLRSDPGGAPPPGCEWGSPQRFTTADTGRANEWAELIQRSLELDAIAAKQAREQDYLAESWARLQRAEDEAFARLVALEQSRQQVRSRGELVAAIGAAEALWAICLMEQQGVPPHAAFLLWLLAFTWVIWRWRGRRWLEGGSDA